MKTYELKIEACHTDNEQIYRSKGHGCAGRVECVADAA